MKFCTNCGAQLPESNRQDDVDRVHRKQQYLNEKLHV